MIKKMAMLLICVLLVVIIYKIFFFNQNSKDTILEVSGIEQSSIETPKITPTPSPVPTPTPIPTPTPFSYYAPTILMSFEELVGNNKDYTEYSKIPTPPPADSYKLVINLYYQFITVFERDSDGDFTIPVRYILCSTGKPSTPTPIGEFEIGSVKGRFVQFEGTDYFAQYWTQLSGTSYLHSILYSRADAYYYKENSFKRLGTKASGGCIRMPVPDARWIWYNIAPGTKAVVIEGEEDPTQAKIKEQLSVILDKFPPDRKRNEILKEKSDGKIPVTEPWPGYTGPITPVLKEKDQEPTIVDELISPQDQK